MAAGRAPRPMSVLVLGVGGNVSQGILKALALSSLPTRTIAGCISPLSLGLYRADLALVTPRADDPDFLPWLEATCAGEGVDAVLSGAEPVLEALAPAAGRIRERTGAVCLVSSAETLEIGQDKLRTASWLERAGLNHPRSAPADDRAAVESLLAAAGLPLVAKPRRGKSAEGVCVVATRDDLERHVGRPDELIQEHLPDGAEYTVGCMTDRDGRVRGTVAMRRELAAGTTVRAEIGDFPDVRAEATAIAAALGAAGPLNVQLRVREGRPVAFDLNVRFSGTTPMRARAGFNEVDAALRHFVLGEPMTLPSVTGGTALRYWNELYVPAEAREALTERGRLEDPWGEPVVVEDWGIRR
jgi:carbamoyl-phosphate synthase large subunit